MKELTTEQLLEKYPYLKEWTKNTIFTSLDDIDNINKGEKIKIGEEEVSIEFIRRILSDDFYFEYASRYFTNKIDDFSLTAIYHGDTIGRVNYGKTTIINAIEKLISVGKLSLKDYEQQRYEFLKGQISFDKFLEETKGNTFNITIDNINYSIKSEQLISFLQLPNDEFDSICLDNTKKEINKIPKDHFVFAAYIFIKKAKRSNNYLLPNNIIERFNDIDSLQKVDFQAINEHLKTPDSKYKDIHIDEELEKEILSGIPENATDLEKAIFIYIKMCKLLTYDEEYFVYNQKGEVTEKHKCLEHISSITLDNNKVVCFEFNLIYSKFLNKLGINFASSYGKNEYGFENPFGEDSYGEGHSNLEFRAGKFLVSADSVTTILQGDIIQAKLNQPLVGLKCINTNHQTQREFKDALTKTYQLIVNQNKKREDNRQVEHIQTLDELLEEYSHTTNSIKDISLKERLFILINKVNSKQLVGIDSLSYVLQLKKILFTELQRRNNIVISIIRNNTPIKEGKTAIASAIIALNGQNFANFPNQNMYYYYNPNQKLISITKE